MRALVTGASRGLGLGLVDLYAGRRDQVVAPCRTPGEELEQLVRANPAITVGVDVGELV